MSNQNCIFYLFISENDGENNCKCANDFTYIGIVEKEYICKCDGDNCMCACFYAMRKR